MQQALNPFDRDTGSDRIQSPYFILFLLLLLSLSAYITSKLGLIAGLALAIIPFVFVFLFFLFRNPILGFYTAIGFDFVLLGLARYVSNIPVGIALDAILILVFIALIFNRFYQRVDWSPAKKDVTLLAIIWLGYSVFELLNPEARSSAAWFSSRGAFSYMVMGIPLTLLLVDSNKKLDTFFLLWGIFSLLVSLKGVEQLFFGVDRWEQAWLDEGNYKTHILFGKLRIFSFLSDAGQFGANQGYSAVVAFIVSEAQKDKRKKLFFLIVAIFALWGMMISGTRGAISIPLAGFATYSFLRKNIRVMFFGFLVLVGVFIFFKYTTLLQNNQQIRRMRTAFDPNDASLQVRIENQRRLSTYLASRPFGGGIGHGGVKAQRFLPNAYLSQVATDSGYVLVWVEMGIVGLMLFLFILFYVVIKSSYRVMFRIRDPMLRLKMAALTSGMVGVMLANYGNAVLTQMPTSLLIYISMALLMNSEQFDTPLSENSLILENKKIQE